MQTSRNSSYYFTALHTLLSTNVEDQGLRKQNQVSHRFFVFIKHSFMGKCFNVLSELLTLKLSEICQFILIGPVCI
jgi:hypothetical protein